MPRPAHLWRLLLCSAFLFLPYLSAKIKADKTDPASVVELVRRAVSNYKAREAQRDDYTYLMHVVRTDYDRRGKRKGKLTGTHEIMFLEGEPYRRAITVNGHPLSPQQEKMEQMLFEAEAKVRQAGHGSQHVREAFSAPIEQLPEQFRLRLRGQQQMDGREVQVIEALPRDENGADEHWLADAGREYARRIKMKLWIDIAESQIVRVDSEVVGDRVVLNQQWPGFDSFLQSPGVTKLRIEFPRGSVASMEWTKVNHETWLPKLAYHKTAKMTVVDVSSPYVPPSLSFPEEITMSFSDYKKFRVDTRIVPK
jgi:hypothetical protein